MTRKKNDDDSAAPKKRRARGDGGLYWIEDRQRWIGEVTIGYRANGRRITRKVSDEDKTKALKKLKDLQREIDDGIAVAAGSYSVSDAVRDFLKHGLHGRSQATVKKLTDLANEHVFSYFGARNLRELTADEVDEWLLDKSATLAGSTLASLRSLLRRSITRAQKRSKVGRNVVLLCDNLPKGTSGRPSKSLNFDQALALLSAAEGTRLDAYIVLSLLVDARTEELRPLTCPDVDLDGLPDRQPPVPPHLYVWRSVREGGDTKTRKSRRALALPQRCVAALRVQRAKNEKMRQTAGARWQPNDLVSRPGTARRWTRATYAAACAPCCDGRASAPRKPSGGRRGSCDTASSLTAGRTPDKPGNRPRLPAPDQARPSARRTGHGPGFPDRSRGLVTQLATQAPGDTR